MLLPVEWVTGVDETVPSLILSLIASLTASLREVAPWSVCDTSSSTFLISSLSTATLTEDTPSSLSHSSKLTNDCPTSTETGTSSFNFSHSLKHSSTPSFAETSMSSSNSSHLSYTLPCRSSESFPPQSMMSIFTASNISPSAYPGHAHGTTDWPSATMASVATTPFVSEESVTVSESSTLPSFSFLLHLGDISSLVSSVSSLP